MSPLFRAGSLIHLFEHCGTDVPDRRMPSDTIVEIFDVLDDRIFCVFACQRRPTIDQLVLERSEEALRNRIIPAVCSPAHAALDVTSFERFSVAVGRMLNAAIPVMDQSFVLRSVTERHGKRIEAKTRLQVIRRGPADDPARVEAHHDSEV